MSMAPPILPTNTTEIQHSPFAKKLNKKLVFNVYNTNTGRPANSTVGKDKSLDETYSAERMFENYFFPSVVSHRLQKTIKYNIKSIKRQFTEK